MASPQNKAPGLPDLPAGYSAQDLKADGPPVGIDFIPETSEDLARALASWEWRIFSGRLYKIMTKDDGEDGDDAVQPFQPNIIQTHFAYSLHNRNVILKARQLGFTTMIAIMWLDHALFVSDQRVGIIAHALDDAEAIFRDKVQFAYENLPQSLRVIFPVEKKTQKEILFAHNNSAIRVATSMRSGTIHRLHVSEMGKIGAAYPIRAKEIVTGSLPAVPATGIVIVESTSEGRSGEFYVMATTSQRVCQTGKPLTPKQFRFHFYPWWTEKKYRSNPKHIPVTEEDHEYFDRIENECDTLLTPGQRAWYVDTRDHEFGGDHTKMWQEYPSTPDECWQQSTSGHYYAKQMAACRRNERIKLFDLDPYLPCDSVWDIGKRDGTGVWVFQITPEGDHKFYRYIQGWNEGYSFYTSQLIQLGVTWRTMYLPHDAESGRQTKDGITTPIEILRGMAPGWNWQSLPRIDSLETGIEITRKHFPKAIFHAEGCKEGLAHLENYQQRWNPAVGAWANEPLKNEATEAADSFRQWAQAVEAGAFQTQSKRTARSKARASVL